MGRPRLNGVGAVRTGFTLPQETLDSLRNHSVQTGRSMSEILREAVNLLRHKMDLLEKLDKDSIIQLHSEGIF